MTDAETVAQIKILESSRWEQHVADLLTAEQQIDIALREFTEIGVELNNYVTV